MAHGTVKWFNESKGYGFISPDDGSHDIFVHITAVQSSGLDKLDEGQKLEFELHQRGDGRTFAQAMKLISDEPADDAEGTADGDADDEEEESSEEHEA